MFVVYGIKVLWRNHEKKNEIKIISAADSSLAFHESMENKKKKMLEKE